MQHHYLNRVAKTDWQSISAPLLQADEHLLAYDQSGFFQVILKFLSFSLAE